MKSRGCMPPEDLGMNLGLNNKNGFFFVDIYKRNSEIAYSFTDVLGRNRVSFQVHESVHAGCVWLRMYYCDFSSGLSTWLLSWMWSAQHYVLLDRMQCGINLGCTCNKSRARPTFELVNKVKCAYMGNVVFSGDMRVDIGPIWKASLMNQDLPNAKVLERALVWRIRSPLLWRRQFTLFSAVRTFRDMDMQYSSKLSGSGNWGGHSHANILWYRLPVLR